jgi:hypothetical protein
MTRTAPAATPVAMPATEAFFNCVPPDDAAARVALGVAMLLDVGCDARVRSVDGVGDVVMEDRKDEDVVCIDAVGGVCVSGRGSDGNRECVADALGESVAVPSTSAVMLLKTDSTLSARSLGAAESSTDSALVVVASSADDIVAESRTLKALVVAASRPMAVIRLLKSEVDFGCDAATAKTAVKFASLSSSGCVADVTRNGKVKLGFV